MKATGIVRRVDDLGRVVIPKEIRRTLHIREGDPLEIFTSKDGGVIFRKYSPMGELQEQAQRLCDAIHSCTGCLAAVSDREAVIAQAGARELTDRPNGPELEAIMEKRSFYCFETGKPLLSAVEGETEHHLGAAMPIVCQGDLMGCVMLLLDRTGTPPGAQDGALVKTAAEFLSRQMEG